jgi:hypothetical protein
MLPIQDIVSQNSVVSNASAVSGKGDVSGKCLDADTQMPKRVRIEYIG